MTLDKKNHGNRGWRKSWTVDMDTKSARHVSGLVSVCEGIGEDDLTVTFKGYRQVDTNLYFLPRLLDEAVRIWIPRTDISYPKNQG